MHGMIPVVFGTRRKFPCGHSTAHDQQKFFWIISYFDRLRSRRSERFFFRRSISSANQRAGGNGGTSTASGSKHAHNEIFRLARSIVKGMPGESPTTQITPVSQANILSVSWQLKLTPTKRSCGTEISDEFCWLCFQMETLTSGRDVSLQYTGSLNLPVAAHFLFLIPVTRNIYPYIRAGAIRNLIGSRWSTFYWEQCHYNVSPSFYWKHIGIENGCFCGWIDQFPMPCYCWLQWQQIHLHSDNLNLVLNLRKCPPGGGRWGLPYLTWRGWLS